MYKRQVHKDVTDRLEHINPTLAAQARIVLDVNKSERHIRGGLATREKYQHRLAICSKPVSYTHLDVYKRQPLVCGYGISEEDRPEEVPGQVITRTISYLDDALKHISPCLLYTSCKVWE